MFFCQVNILQTKTGFNTDKIWLAYSGSNFYIDQNMTNYDYVFFVSLTVRMDICPKTCFRPNIDFKDIIFSLKLTQIWMFCINQLKAI